jgi:hypothetical protein
MRPGDSISAGDGSVNDRKWRATIGFIATAVALVAVHLSLIVYFEPLGLIINRRPLSGGDLSTHYAQTERVIEGLVGWGKSWVYDVHQYAGHPNGTIFDADNKGWELWTYGLYRLGLPKAVAFNAFVLLVHLLVVPVFFWSARLFRLGRWSALLCAALGCALWFFDSLAHFGWYVGAVSATAVSYLSLLPLALFYRFLQARGWVRGLTITLLLGICHLIHPYTFFIMVAPMAALYLPAAKRLGAKSHIAIAGMAFGVVALNAYWLRWAIYFWHYILNSAFGGQSDITFLSADFFGLLLDPSVTGLIGTRTGFRFLCLGAAVVTLVLWRRARDDRFWTFSVSLGAMLLMAYLGGYFEPSAQIQPYRFALTAAFFSLIPAAALAEELHRKRLLYQLPATAWAVMAILALPAIQHLSADILYFFPDALPRGVPVIHERVSDLTSSGYPRHYAYRREPLSSALEQLALWVKVTHDGQGRILVQHGMVGEELSWRTNAEILGGFQFHNLAHAYSNLFRRDFLGQTAKAMFRQYLETYAVRWLIVSFRRPWFDDKPDLLVLRAKFSHFLIYETKSKVSLFYRGSGRITASTNRIAVRDTDPNQTLVLRYHWLETLVCEPNCSVKPIKVPLGAVPFIRIRAPHPRDFVIRNGY